MSSTCERRYLALAAVRRHRRAPVCAAAHEQRGRDQALSSSRLGRQKAA